MTPDPAALAALLRELAQYDLRDPRHRLGPDLADAYAAVIASMAAPGSRGDVRRGNVAQAVDVAAASGHSEVAAPRAVQAGEPIPTAAEIAEHTRWRGQYP